MKEVCYIIIRIRPCATQIRKPSSNFLPHVMHAVAQDCEEEIQNKSSCLIEQILIKSKLVADHGR